jgi:hypothetical protein
LDSAPVLLERIPLETQLFLLKKMWNLESFEEEYKLLVNSISFVKKSDAGIHAQLEKEES